VRRLGRHLEVEVDPGDFQGGTEDHLQLVFRGFGDLGQGQLSEHTLCHAEDARVLGQGKGLPEFRLILVCHIILYDLRLPLVQEIQDFSGTLSGRRVREFQRCGESSVSGNK